MQKITKAAKNLGQHREHESPKVRRRKNPRASKDNPPLVLVEWEDAAVPSIYSSAPNLISLWSAGTMPA